MTTMDEDAYIIWKQERIHQLEDDFIEEHQADFFIWCHQKDMDPSNPDNQEDYLEYNEDTFNQYCWDQYCLTE